MIPENHTDITNNGLKAYYYRDLKKENAENEIFIFNDSTKKLICDSNNDSDESYNRNQKIADNYNVSAQHFNRTDLKECEKFLKKSKEVVVEDFIKAVNSTNSEEEENYTKAFYDFGRLTHCIQDFYSHTNWINQTGPVTATWNESIDNMGIKTYKPENGNENTEKPMIKNPENLKTGRYKSKLTDFFAPIKHFFQKLFKKEKSYENTYFKNDDKEITHYMLNKDEENTVASKAFLKNEYKTDTSIKEEDKRSGYEVARDDAIQHTHDEWVEIMETLDEKLDNKTYNELLSDIKEFKAEPEEYKSKLKKYGTDFNEKIDEKMGD